MKAFTLKDKLDNLARRHELPPNAKVVVRRPHMNDETVDSVRQRKDGTIVITTRGRWW